LPRGAPATASSWHPRPFLARGVLGATALLTLASLWLCCWVHPDRLIVDGTIPCAAGAALGACVLLRSLRFAAIAGVACAGAMVSSCGALAVLGWLLPRAQSGAIWNFSGAPGGVAFAIFMDGVVAAGLVLWQLRIAATEVSQGAVSDAAARAARNRSLGLGVASLLSVTAPKLLMLYREVRNLEIYSASSLEASALAAIVGAAVVMWFCFVVLPLVIAGSRSSEEAIVHINRSDEWFQRAVATIDFLLEPRWALTVTGIAAILFALAFLDRSRMSDGRTAFAVLEIWNTQAVTFYGTGLAIFAIGLVLTKSWRGGLSGAVAAVFSGTIAAWIALRTGLVPSPDATTFDYFGFRAWEMAATGSAAIAGLLFLVGSVAGAGAHDGKAAQQEMATALSESAGAVICIALTSVLASVFALSPAGTLLAIAGPAAALVVQPCLYVALNTLIPRYRSVEDIFGRK